MVTPEQLRILSIGHYVAGAVHALFGSFGLIHFSLGILMICDPSFFNGGGPGSMAPPAFVGVLFAALGGAFVLFGWTLGALTVLSGRYIAQRKNRTFSIVMGIINCMMVPVGTVLGVFDLVILTSPEVQKEYLAKAESRS